PGGEAAVTPASSGVSDDRAQRIREVRRSAVLASALTAVLLVVAMVLPDFAGSGWLQLVLASAILFGPGARVFRVAVSQARHAAANMDTLIALGAAASY